MLLSKNQIPRTDGSLESVHMTIFSYVLMLMKKNAILGRFSRLLYRYMASLAGSDFGTRLKTARSKTNDCKLKYKVTCYKANHKTIESDSLLRHSGHVWYILSHKGNSYHTGFIRLKNSETFRTI